MEIFNKIVDYVSENPLYAIIAGGALVVIILLAIIISATKKRKKKKLEQAKQLAAAKATATPTVAKPATVEKAKTVEPVKAPEPVKVVEPVKAPEPVKVPEPAKVVEPVKAPKKVKTMEKPTLAVANEPVKETPIEEAPIVEEPIEEVVVTAPVKTTTATTLHDELKDAETDDTFFEEDVEEQEARYKGKWVICRVVTDDKSEEELYFFELHASNGEKLLTSEEYTSYNGALRGIQTHKTNILKGNFRITVSKRGEYIFKLLSGKNMLLCLGESYATKARCESAIASTKRFAETAIIDENVQYQVVKIPVEDDTPIIPLKEGCKGKWIIDCTDSPEGEKIYTFELFANNGERLLSSEEYTTYIGAVNGIQTHKANIDKGNFRIVLTKRGDYIYKLLNSNGQLLCLGEHYKNKRLCQNAVESVKRFAFNSPILTSPKIKN